MNNTFLQDLQNVLKTFYDGALQFLPHLLAAVIIIAAGWICGVLLKKLLRRTFTAARFDQRSANSGFTQLLERADILTAPSELVGRCAFWLVFVTFLVASLSTLGFAATQELVAGFFVYLPRLFVALLILLLGFLVGSFLARAAVLALVNAGVGSAHLAGSAVRLLIGILAFAMALDQLQIARGIVTAAFTIAFGAVMLGLALAFGLGGRDVARQLLEERLHQRSRKEEDVFSHL